MRLERAKQPASPGPPPDPESEQWSRVEHLLAGIRDEIHFLRYGYTTAHTKHVKWKPEQLPRPGVSSSSRPKRAPITGDQTEVLFRHLQATQNLLAAD